MFPAQENFTTPRPLYHKGVGEGDNKTYPAEGIIPLSPASPPYFTALLLLPLFAFTVIGGYRIMTSAGNAENVESGKKMLVGVAFLAL